MPRTTCGAWLIDSAPAERHVPRDVCRVRRGLHRVAHDDVVHVRGGNAGPLDRRLRRDGAEVGGGELLERAAEGAEPGADAGEEDDFGAGAHTNRYGSLTVAPQVMQCFQSESSWVPQRSQVNGMSRSPHQGQNTT